MGIKDQLVNWQVNRRIKSLKRTKKFFNLESAKTAGIIFNCEDRAAVERLKRTLSQKQIRCTDLCFIAGSADNLANCISEHDFSFWGMPKSDKLIGFLNSPFDLLIDISMSSRREAQVIRALSMASFKTGWSDAKPDFFDLSIDVSKRRESGFLVDQITHYLTEIQ